MVKVGKGTYASFCLGSLGLSGGFIFIYMRTVSLLGADGARLAKHSGTQKEASGRVHSIVGFTVWFVVLSWAGVCSTLCCLVCQGYCGCVGLRCRWWFVPPLRSGCLAFRLSRLRLWAVAQAIFVCQDYEARQQALIMGIAIWRRVRLFTLPVSFCVGRVTSLVTSELSSRLACTSVVVCGFTVEPWSCASVAWNPADWCTSCLKTLWSHGQVEDYIHS